MCDLLVMYELNCFSSSGAQITASVFGTVVSQENWSSDLQLREALLSPEGHVKHNNEEEGIKYIYI